MHRGNILFLLENHLHGGNLSPEKYGFTLLLFLKFVFDGRCPVHPAGHSIFSVETGMLTCENCSLPDEHDATRESKFVSSSLEGFGLLLIP